MTIISKLSMTNINKEHVTPGSVISLRSLIISERVTTVKWVSFFGGASLFEYKILLSNVNFDALYFNMLKFQCLLKDLRCSKFS